MKIVLINESEEMQNSLEGFSNMFCVVVPYKGPSAAVRSLFVTCQHHSEITLKRESDAISLVRTLFQISRHF
jgi:hypothetical protein